MRKWAVWTLCWKALSKLLLHTLPETLPGVFFSHCLRHVRLQVWRTVVYAQMALIHTYPCIKPHESKAVINYAQLVTTLVGVNYHESWERNACSMLKDRIFRAQTSVNFVSDWTKLLSFMMNYWFISDETATRSSQRWLTEHEKQDHPCPRLPTRLGWLHLNLALRLHLNVWPVGAPMDYGLAMLSRNRPLSTGTKRGEGG